MRNNKFLYNRPSKKGIWKLGQRRGYSYGRQRNFSSGLLLKRERRSRLKGLITRFSGYIDSISFSQRINYFSAGIVLLSIGLVLRLYGLQHTEFGKWQQIAERQHHSSIRIQGARGNILDADGRVLAVSVKALSIGAHLREIKDLDQTALTLSKLLKQDEKLVKNKLNSSKQFIWLARGLPMSFEEPLKNLALEGISTVQEFRRYYPQGSIAGPILGKVGRDGSGLSGIERFYDETLAAADLSLPVKRDARGRILANVENSIERFSVSNLLSGFSLINSGIDNAYAYEEDINLASMPRTSIRNEGKAIRLSIDAAVQNIVEEEMSIGKEKSKAKRVFGIVMDAESGEILALSQSPGFNPNRLENVSSEELRNSVIQDSFEPGSTLKPLVAAVALQEGVVRGDESLDCENGKYLIGKHTVRDVHPEGNLPFGEILVRSSNVCMAKLGQRLGKQRLYRALTDFGFGSLTNVELPGEAKGILRSYEKWAEIDEATHAFGQGISVTAIQLVQAYSALANNGYMVIPTLLKRESVDHVAHIRVLTEKVANHVASILSGVTESEHGTGRNAAIPGVSVMGKTGTAQKARLNGKGYDSDRVLSSFIGFVNGEQIGLKRKLVMFVAVDEPTVKPRWGGVVAAPIFKNSVSRILSYLLSVEPGAGRTA